MGTSRPRVAGRLGLLLTPRGHRRLERVSQEVPRRHRLVAPRVCERGAGSRPGPAEGQRRRPAGALRGPGRGERGSVPSGEAGLGPEHRQGRYRGDGQTPARDLPVLRGQSPTRPAQPAEVGVFLELLT